MTNAGIFEESELNDKLRKLKKEIKVLKADKLKGENDLERIIEELRREIDILKTIKEIDKYTKKQPNERKNNDNGKKKLDQLLNK
tara:strand:- start:21 stop:275 length:255 start_codon:yes stop_codon:yes gene_type:complete